MFLATLPEQVQLEIKRRLDIVTTQQCVDYVIEQLGTYNDKRLAAQQATRLQKTLGHTRNSPTAALVEQTQQVDSTMQLPAQAASQVCTQADLTAQMNKIEAVVAALRRNAGPGTRAAPNANKNSNNDKPDPRFEGCWHCAKKGHSRQECQSYKKLIAANGGKRPAGYKGAYEKWRDAQKNKGVHTAAIIESEPDQDHELEFDETEFVQLKGLFCPPCPPLN